MRFLRRAAARYGAVALFLLSGAAQTGANAPAAPWSLSWDYAEHGPEITFNVYSSTNLSAWTFRTNTAGTNFFFEMQTVEFFHVTATNSLTGLESD